MKNRVQVGDVWECARNKEERLITAMSENFALFKADSEIEEAIPLDALLFTSLSYGRLIERDGDRIRIVKPETIEDRIKAQYPDYEVVMLKENECFDLVLNAPGLPLHINAQSMKGFAGYVYRHEENDWLKSSKPVKSWRNKYIHPKAVLFSREFHE